MTGSARRPETVQRVSNHDDCFSHVGVFSYPAHTDNTRGDPLWLVLPSTLREAPGNDFPGIFHFLNDSLSSQRIDIVPID
jgi:hypothetical protein